MKAASPLRNTGGLLVLAALLVGGLSVAAQAQETSARIQITSSTKQKDQKLTVDNTSPGARVVPADWAGEMKDRIIDVTLPAAATWQEGSVTFTAAEDGNVVVTLLGPYIRVDEQTRELKPVLVEYDNVQADVAVIKNGSFERTNTGDGLPAYWNLTEIDGKPPIDDTNRAKIVTEDVADGGNAVRVWHNSRFYQIFFVEKGVPVTVTFSYRLAP